MYDFFFLYIYNFCCKLSTQNNGMSAQSHQSFEMGVVVLDCPFIKTGSSLGVIPKALVAQAGIPGPSRSRWDLPQHREEGAAQLPGALSSQPPLGIESQCGCDFYMCSCVFLETLSTVSGKSQRVLYLKRF